MKMNRRDALKLGALSVAAAAIPTTAGAHEVAKPKTIGLHQVVIIGGGIGGLSVAKELMKKDKKLDVLVIERNDNPKAGITWRAVSDTLAPSAGPASNTMTNLTGGTTFTIATPRLQHPLPIELLSFDAYYNSKKKRNITCGGLSFILNEFCI